VPIIGKTAARAVTVSIYAELVKWALEQCPRSAVTVVALAHSENATPRVYRGLQQQRRRTTGHGQRRHADEFKMQGAAGAQEGVRLDHLGRMGGRKNPSLYFDH
jgi:hypothetical protein